jgi:hypothetical protein
MASDLETAFGNFERMPEEQRRQMDKTLSFLEVATTATPQGARNRELMREQGVSPEALKAMAAYRAYKYKMKHEAMPSRDKAMLRLQGVPEQEIERLDSREKWEAGTLGHYEKLGAMTRPTFDMEPETILGDEPKQKPKAKKQAAKSAPMPAVVPPPAEGAPAPAAGPAMAAPMAAPAAMPGPMAPGPVGAPMFDAPLAPGPAPAMTLGGQQLAEQQKRMPLALALNGGM